jgi:hypothetical protein
MVYEDEKMTDPKQIRDPGLLALRNDSRTTWRTCSNRNARRGQFSLLSIYAEMTYVKVLPNASLPKTQQLTVCSTFPV